MPTYQLRRARNWPYMPTGNSVTDFEARQYRPQNDSDAYSPAATLPPAEQAKCEKCGAEMTRRELWRHRC